MRSLVEVKTFKSTKLDSWGYHPKDLDFGINYFLRIGFTFINGMLFWNETKKPAKQTMIHPHPLTSPSSTSCLAHAAAAHGRQLFHLVPAVRVVEEGHVLVVGGPAAGCVVPQLPGCRLREHTAQQQVGKGEVVVGADAGTCATTVLEEDGLVWVVAQPEISNLQQDGAQATVGV